jgi:hypothetical protein
VPVAKVSAADVVAADFKAEKASWHRPAIR